MTLRPIGGVTRLALAVLALSATLSLVSAHGTAEWIQRGGYKNAAGELCCGERDCFELASGDVTITAAGYFVHSTRESVPFSEALPSPDGHYWRCQWGGRAQVLLRSAAQHLNAQTRGRRSHSSDCSARTKSESPV